MTYIGDCRFLKIMIFYTNFTNIRISVCFFSLNIKMVFLKHFLSVPTKNTTKRQRKYKDITHRRRHRTTPSPDVESEKIYFDFLPETPLLIEDENGNVRSRKTQFKLLPASQEVKDGDESSATKDKLLKRPKKYHRRIRRDLAAARASADDHVVRSKRNPFFRHQAPQNNADVQQPVQTHYVYVK